jgi:hypothetical protein
MKAFSKKTVEKLVAEQKGGRHFWIGIFISILLGFTIRAYISPQNIHRYLIKATQSVGSEVQISWSQASLKLRKGLFLPRLTLEIENFQLVSIDSCAGEPILFSKKVDVPVQILSWISTGKPLESLYLIDSFLEFRTSLQCRQKEVSDSPIKKLSVQKAVRIKAKDELQNRPPLVLKGFYFEKIKIRHPQLVNDWMIDRFEVQVLENQPWNVILQAQFPIPETDSVDSLVKTYLNYKEFPTPQLDINVKGHWREGNFEAQGDWDLSQQSWKLKSKFNHFPIQFLKIIAQKAKAPWNWPNDPMWFSFDLEAEDRVKDLSRLQLLLRGVHIEGDLGELKVPDLRIVGLKPLKVEPFVFQAEAIQLDKILSKQFKMQKPLESLGVMTGQGQWIAQNEFRFSGEFDNIKLQFPSWFSNKPYWKLKADRLTAHLKKGNWEINTQDLSLDGSSVEGQFQLSGDQDLKKGKLKSQLKISQLPNKIFPSLNLVEVQNLSLQSQFDWENREDLSWGLDYSFEAMSNEHLTFKNHKGLLKSKKRGWELKGQFQDGVFTKPFSLIQNWSLPESTWPLDLRTSQIFIEKKDDAFSWKWVSSSLNIEGLQDRENELLGRLKLNSKDYQYSKSKSDESITLVPN